MFFLFDLSSRPPKFKMTCLMYAVYALLGVCLAKVLEWFIRMVPVSELDKKFVVVTGCDSGFGKLLAKKLDKKGFRVIACCYTSDGEKELQSSCSDKLRTVHLDVSTHQSVEDCYQEVKKILPPDTGKQGLSLGKKFGEGGLQTLSK